MTQHSQTTDNNKYHNRSLIQELNITTKIDDSYVLETKRNPSSKIDNIKKKKKDDKNLDNKMTINKNNKDTAPNLQQYPWTKKGYIDTNNKDSNLGTLNEYAKMEIEGPTTEYKIKEGYVDKK